MATKWKSRLSIGVCAFLFTFGLSGLIIVSAFGSTYVHRDYFHTTQFRDELNLFAQYLNLFELNHIPIESAKQSITVSQDEIEEYRNRFGNITEKLTFLKDEYKFLIDGAELANNQDAVEIYIAERDRKIEEITQVFKSDDYARAKIITDKEKRVEEYYQGKEQYYLDFLSYKGQLQYYFTSDVSDKVYTNVILADDESITDKMNSHSMSYISSYSIPTEDSDSYYWLRQYNQRANSLIPFKGEIAVSKALPSSSSIAIKYNKYKQEQILVWAYTFASVVSLVLCIFLVKKIKYTHSPVERWSPYYNKLPIDVRAALIVLTGWVTLYLLFSIQDQFLYVLDNPFVSGWSLFIGMVFASIGLAITLAQGRLMAGRIKDWKYIQEEWRKGLLNKAGQSAKAQFIQIKISLKDAFLKTSTGAQLFIVLTIVFGLGLAALMVILNPDFMVAYMVLLAAIGVPLSMVLIRRIGYFNRIVLQANDLAIGKLGPDVQVPGKSVLATLAGNMNVLKQGVTTLQNEQAKSERLKTELITNVSHDLRTPLTSIKGYVEGIRVGIADDPEKLKKYVDVIYAKALDMDRMIDDLFLLSKLDLEQEQFYLESVPLESFYRQTISELQMECERAGVRLTSEYEAGQEDIVTMDIQKIKRVMLNLVGNSIKFMDKQDPHVHVHFGRQLENWVFTVTDNGPGMGPAELERIFDRFYRGDAFRNQNVAGSGLGLAIVKQIIVNHGGTIQARSEPGQSMKVIVSIPIKRDSKEAGRA